MKFFINETINYIIIRHFKLIELVKKTIIDVKRKIISRSSSLKSILYFSID